MHGELTITELFVPKDPSQKRATKILGKADCESFMTALSSQLYGIIDADLGAKNTDFYKIFDEGVIRFYKNQLDFDTAFDDLINFLNRRVFQTFPEKNINDKCHVLIGAQNGRRVLFSANGNISAYLSYPHNIKKILPQNDDQAMDVSNKLFSYSLNGEIFHNYLLYFINADMEKAINPYKLGKTMEENSPEAVLAAAENYLALNAEGRPAGIFIFYKSAAPAPIGKMEIFDNEKNTEKILSPSLANNFGEALRNRSLGQALAFSEKSLRIFFKGLKKTAFFSGATLINAFFIATNLRGKRKEKQTVMGNQFKGLGFKAVGFYKALTPISKLILAALLLFTVALSGVVSYSLKLQKINRIKAAYTENVNRAQELYAEAESDYLFQQKNVAVKKLKSALDLLEAVPEIVRDSAYKSLASQAKAKFYKIQNAAEINSPLLIADFSAEAETDIYPPLYISDGSVGTFSQSATIKIDAAKQSITRQNLSVAGLKNGLYYYSPAKNSIYGIENETTLHIADLFTLNSRLQEIVLGNDESISRFVIYNGIMYALSPSGKHFSIWKHNASLSGFGKPSLWITDNLADNQNASSFTVDGNVYVLFTNNEINKYYQGRKVAWNYDKDGAGGNVVYTKIFTNEDLPYLYLMAKDRISILSKDGEFTGHYILPSLKNITDFVLDESSKVIYILAGEKIYSFPYNL